LSRIQGHIDETIGDGVQEVGEGRILKLWTKYVEGRKILRCHGFLMLLMAYFYFRRERMIRINYLDEREWVVKREIDTKLTMTPMTPKNYGTQVLSVEGHTRGKV